MCTWCLLAVQTTALTTLVRIKPSDSFELLAKSTRMHSFATRDVSPLIPCVCSLLAAVLCFLALDFHAIMAKLQMKNHQPIDIRIGIHSGEVCVSHLA